MIQILGLAFILAIIFLPQFLVRKVIKKYHSETSYISGTGGELAQHLLNKLGIKNIKIIESDLPDSYDPIAKTLHLSRQTYNSKSLSAITITAHEIGHILQDNSNSLLFKLRIIFVKIWKTVQIVGNVLLLFSPFLLILKPSIGLSVLGIYFLIALLGIAIHLCTLPLELDASFAKALPLLIKGKYIPKKYIPAAKRILTAAALTYLAAALNNIFFTIFSWRRLIRP